MGVFKINKSKLEIAELSQHRYKNEGYSKISPQYLIAKFPSLILSIPELEVADSEKYLVIREFNAGRGPIDILIITENSEIILVENQTLPQSRVSQNCGSSGYRLCQGIISGRYGKAKKCF